MGRGNSGISGGAGGNQTVLSQARENIKGVSGYNVTTADGGTMEFYFAKNDDGDTLYGNSINNIANETPNGWTENQMIAAIQNNGGTVDKYSKNQLLQIEVDRLNDRVATNTMLNNAYARNADADVGHRAYRNTRRANRISRRK